MVAVAKKPAKASDFSRTVACRITDEDLWDALEELIDEQKYPTTFTDVITIALQELLKKEGKYPRPKR